MVSNVLIGGQQNVVKRRVTKGRLKVGRFPVATILRLRDSERARVHQWTKRETSTERFPDDANSTEVARGTTFRSRRKTPLRAPSENESEAAAKERLDGSPAQQHPLGDQEIHRGDEGRSWDSIQGKSLTLVSATGLVSDQNAVLSLLLTGRSE